MTFMLNFGKWGGIYFRRGYSTRLCLGFVALTWFPCDMDDVLVQHVAGLAELHKREWVDIDMPSDAEWVG